MSEEEILLDHWNKMDDKEKFLFQFSYIRFLQEVAQNVLAFHRRKGSLGARNDKP